MARISRGTLVERANVRDEGSAAHGVAGQQPHLLLERLDARRPARVLVLEAVDEPLRQVEPLRRRRRRLAQPVLLVGRLDELALQLGLARLERRHRVAHRLQLPVGVAELRLRLLEQLALRLDVEVDVVVDADVDDPVAQARRGARLDLM